MCVFLAYGAGALCAGFTEMMHHYPRAMTDFEIKDRNRRVWKTGCAAAGVVAMIFFMFGCAPATVASHQAVPPVKPVEAPRDESEGWIKGSLTSLEDGTRYEFRIQKKMAWGGSATGGVVAIHPETKARLSGQYTAMLQSSRAAAFAMNSSRQWASGWATETSRNANAFASLTGVDLAIQLRLEIMSGFSPHGMGEGIDNHGHHYQVQF